MGPRGQRSRGDKGDFLRLPGECQPASQALVQVLRAEPGGQAGSGAMPGPAPSAYPICPPEQGKSSVLSPPENWDPIPQGSFPVPPQGPYSILPRDPSHTHPESLTQHRHILRNPKSFLKLASFFSTRLGFPKRRSEEFVLKSHDRAYRVPAPEE